MSNSPIILFDGVCNFCNGVVNFIIRQDKKKIFKFAPLQSEAGKKFLSGSSIDRSRMNSFVLVEDGKIYTRSTAALKLYNKLPWYWKWTQVFWLVPTRLRDVVYDFVARNRYKWFGKRDVCMVPGKDVRERFV